MEKCVAIIPARGGSKGIKDKNLQKIGGISLVERAVKSCMQAGFNSVYILSDSEAIRTEAAIYGANSSFLRPASISESHSHMFSLYKWFFTAMLDQDGTVPQSFCCVLPTTPFRPVSAISEAKSSLETGKYDWVLTINEQEHHPYRTMVKADSISGELIEPFVDVPPEVFWSNRQE